MPAIRALILKVLGRGADLSQRIVGFTRWEERQDNSGVAEVDTVRSVSPNEPATTRLIVAGADGTGREVADAAALSKRWHCIDFLHNDMPPQMEYGACRVLGSLEKATELHADYADGIVVLPGNERRVTVSRDFLKVGYFLPCIVHPLGSIAESVMLDFGCVILAQAVVGPDTVIGMASVIRAGATIAADSNLGAGVSVGAGAHIGSGVNVGNYSQIGMGAIIEDGVMVGSRVIVGAGAVVNHDLPDGVKAVGVPARILPY